jgi:hypothetical protein
VDAIKLSKSEKDRLVTKYRPEFEQAAEKIGQALRAAKAKVPAKAAQLDAAITKLDLK